MRMENIKSDFVLNNPETLKIHKFLLLEITLDVVLVGNMQYGRYRIMAFL